MSDFWQKVDKTLRYHGKHAAINARGYWWDCFRTEVKRPVFVIGCSRAGTTLVYKTLSESGEIGTLQRETHDFWAEMHPLPERNWNTHALSVNDASAHDREIVSRYFFSWTGKSRFVDKNNQNGLCVPYLLTLFPDAFFVYVKRHPGDNLNSLIEGWGKPEEFASWSRNLPATIEIDNGSYENWCFFLADGWRELTNRPIEEVCAFQYDAINRSILEARASVPGKQWHEVFYEDLVRDPVVKFRSMFDACDLRFDRRLEQHCKDVLNHPYNAFSTIQLDKWKKGRNTVRIRNVLSDVQPVANQMGYDLK